MLKHTAPRTTGSGLNLKGLSTGADYFLVRRRPQAFAPVTAGAAIFLRAIPRLVLGAGGAAKLDWVEIHWANSRAMSIGSKTWHQIGITLLAGGQAAVIVAALIVFAASLDTADYEKANDLFQ